MTRKINQIPLKNLPKEYKQRIGETTAEDLNEVLGDFGAAPIIMSGDDLKAELAAIDTALPKRTPVFGMPSVTDYAPATLEQVVALAQWFAGLFGGGFPPTNERLALTLGKPHPATETLRGRLAQLRIAIDSVMRVRNRDYDATDAFLVPAMWVKRWEFLVSGYLVPVYAPFVDVGRVGGFGVKKPGGAATPPDGGNAA